MPQILWFESRQLNRLFSGCQATTESLMFCFYDYMYFPVAKQHSMCEYIISQLCRLKRIVHVISS